jgi:hypothetical protein
VDGVPDREHEGAGEGGEENVEDAAGHEGRKEVGRREGETEGLRNGGWNAKLR